MRLCQAHIGRSSAQRTDVGLVFIGFRVEGEGFKV